MTATKDRRNSTIAAIHVARTQLPMHEEDYRAMLRRISAKHGPQADSSAKLNAEQLIAVLEELRRLGATRPGGARKARSYPGRPHNLTSVTCPELLAKVEAQLADMKLPWSYADAIARQQHGVDRVAWVRQPEQLSAVVAALHVEQEKRSLDIAVNAELKRLGWTPDRVVELLKPLRPNWRRHRPSMRLVLKFLQEQVG